VLAQIGPWFTKGWLGSTGLAKEGPCQLSAYQLGLQNLFSHCGGAGETTSKALVM
jgi:hypothetical protein